MLNHLLLNFLVVGTAPRPYIGMDEIMVVAILDRMRMSAAASPYCRAKLFKDFRLERCD